MRPLPLLTVLFEHAQSLQKFGRHNLYHDHSKDGRSEVADRFEVCQELENSCNGERLLFFVWEQYNYKGADSHTTHSRYIILSVWFLTQELRCDYNVEDDAGASVARNQGQVAESHRDEASDGA